MENYKAYIRVYDLGFLRAHPKIDPDKLYYASVYEDHADIEIDWMKVSAPLGSFFIDYICDGDDAPEEVRFRGDYKPGVFDAKEATNRMEREFNSRVNNKLNYISLKINKAIEDLKTDVFISSENISQEIKESVIKELENLGFGVEENGSEMYKTIVAGKDWLGRNKFKTFKEEGIWISWQSRRPRLDI